MRSWKEICRESIVQVSNNTFNLQNHSGTFKSYRKSAMKYDHWVKMEGNQENHHVLNDLPLKRALWGVKKGSNAKHSYWNIVFPTRSLLTLRWRWLFLRSRCLASKLCYDEFQIFENEHFSKQFRNNNTSYHYAGTMDAQMLSYFFEMFKNCLESWFNHFLNISRKFEKLFCHG